MVKLKLKSQVDRMKGIRGRPVPPPKVFKNRRKEANRKACRRISQGE